MLEVTAQLRRGDFALDVRFEAPTPGVIALFGRSGCGKTTVLHAIAGLLTPESGRIALEGVTWFEAGVTNSRAERRRIGCVFQDARLFPHFSVLGNLRYGARRAPSDSRRIAEADVVDLLGLGELLSRRPHQLSGGERHRVAIGRALLSQPRLLLLDEPLAAQDLARRADLLPYLERLCSGLRMPMVYVSHQFDEVVRLASHVVLIDTGRVVAQGSVGEIAQSPALRAIVGPDELGAVVDGEIESLDPASGRARVRVGASSIGVSLSGARVGQRARVHLPAREIVLALEAPTVAMSADVLPGKVTVVEEESSHSLLVAVDVGGAVVFARVPRDAAVASALAPGRPVSLLINGAWSSAYGLGPSRADE